MAPELIDGTDEEDTNGNTGEEDEKGGKKSADEEKEDEESVDEKEDVDLGHIRGEEISWLEQVVSAIETVGGASSEQYSLQQGVEIGNFQVLI